MATHQLRLRVVFNGLPAKEEAQDRALKSVRAALPDAVVELEDHVIAVTTAELSEGDWQLIEDARMSPEHDHLNRLLDDGADGA